MKTWVLWTHYDCEVYVSLHPSEDAAWNEMKSNWLEDCDEDCGHNPEEEMSISEIASALEYHVDELEFGICEFEVPVAYTTPEDIEQMGQTIQAALDRNTMPAATADDLLSKLESYQGAS
jgi:hypothetical protein